MLFWDCDFAKCGEDNSYNHMQNFVSFCLSHANSSRYILLLDFRISRYFKASKLWLSLRDINRCGYLANLEIRYVIDMIPWTFLIVGSSSTYVKLLNGDEFP